MPYKEEIKIYNRHTGKVLVKQIDDPAEADELESILDFLQVEYEHCYNGVQMYY